MWNNTIHTAYRLNKAKFWQGKMDLKDYKRVNSTKKKLGELIFINLIPQFHIRTRNRLKIIRTKKGSRRAQTIKRKGQGSDLSKS